LQARCNYARAGLGVGSPVTYAPATVEAGRKLFAEPGLSSNDRVSCKSCHHPEHAFSDPRQVSVEVGGARGIRNASTLQNLAYSDNLFWDGRALTVAAAARQALTNTHEMNATDRVIATAV